MSRRLSILTFLLIIVTFLAGFVAPALTHPTSHPPNNKPAEPLLPSKSILFFYSTTCPPGWTEVTSARGRYIVGRPSGGTLAGTASDNLDNLENRDVGQAHTAFGYLSAHTHSITSGGSIFAPGGSNGVSLAQGTLTVTLSPVSGIPAGTPAPYIQFLVCQKL